MSERPPLVEDTLAGLGWPLRLTRLGLIAERITRSFWPVWSILLAAIAIDAFDLQDALPLEMAWTGLMLILAGLLWGLWSGIRRFRWPSREEALDRLDATLPGRPLATLRDTQAIGAGDEGSTGVWQAHLARMAARAAGARAVLPDLRLSRQDPFALRYMALLVFLLAVGFGSIWRIGSTGPLPGAGAALAAGPSWEGWVQPPTYTGKPTLYLNDIQAKTLDVPQGSKITLRLYGKVGALTVAETVSGRTGEATGEAGSASAADQAFDVTRSGTLSIDGAGGRSWQIHLVPDTPPQVAILRPPERKASGEMQLAFHAKDDYGVRSGTATITLDLAKVDRRYGLATAPEPRKPIVLDLPMPVTGKRSDFQGLLVDDLQKSAWANLPVKITLSVKDDAGQVGQSKVMETVLPGRRFFDPLAAAVIEMRRDLLWSKANAERADEILRAVTWKPEGFIKNEKAYLLLRVTMKRLEAGIKTGLTAKARDDVAEALWQVAVELEKGTLSDALDRLHQAQDRLSQAIRRGASKDEIAKLMQDLNQALQNYVARLAEQQQNGQDRQTAQNQQGQMITGDQMQQLLDRLQQLMEQGKMAEAQQLLDRLRQLTENMQVAQGQGGMQIPGGKAMKGLTDTLRQQQQLSDNTFQDLQRRFEKQGQQGFGEPGQNQSQQGQGQGQQQGQQQGRQPGQGQQGQGGQSLADRQGQLQRELQRQAQGILPGDGTQAGKDARDALGRAGRAMNEAEQALRQGDNARALDQQAQAMDALRQGLHSMDQAMRGGDKGRSTAQNGQQPQPGGQNGQMSDPLGRQVGENGALGTSRNMLLGEDVYRRARQLLDELRKRSGDTSRPSFERDYIKRLLNLF